MSRRHDRPRQPIQITVSIPPKFVPTLERTADVEQRRNPNATTAQLFDTIFLRGLIFTHDAIASGIALPDPDQP